MSCIEKKDAGISYVQMTGAFLFWGIRGPKKIKQHSVRFFLDNIYKMYYCIKQVIQ